MLLLLCVLALTPYDFKAQCPPPSADIVISGLSSANYTLNVGDTLHLSSSANYSGNVTIQGGVIINCATATQNMIITSIPSGNISKVFNYENIDLSAANDHYDIDIYNYGTIDKIGDLVMDTDAKVHNYGTLLISGKITSKLGGEYHNYGTLTAAADLKSEITGGYYNYNTGSFSAQKFILNGYFYNSGQVNCGTHYNSEGIATTDNEGGCWNIAGDFINKGIINGLVCGTFTISGTSDNQGTITGPVAFVDASATSSPYVDSNSGSMTGVTGSSCSCPGAILVEICGNLIDDDGDGLVDCEDPDCDGSLACPDNDGDTVLDMDDLDDDNDGILDTNEGCEDADIAGTIGVGINVTSTAYVLNGTTLTYARSGSSEANLTGYTAGSHGDAIRFSASSGNSGTLSSTFTNPVSAVYFKLTDFDEYESYTINIYDKDNNLYDLSSEGVLLVGSTILQTGNLFDCQTSEATAGGPAVDGDNPADDSLGSVIIYISGTVSKIDLIYNHPLGSSVRYIQPTFCSVDSDSDSVFNHFDLDSDNDGIFDVFEAGGIDADFDGVIGTGSVMDTDEDGWSNITDPDNSGTPLTDGDLDGDGDENRIDSDSDSDGCKDVIEAGFPDSDGDGKLGGLVPPTVDSKGKVTSGGL